MCRRDESAVRGDMGAERGDRLVHDARTCPQLVARPPLVRGGERRPCLCEILPVGLPGHDPSVPLGDALPEDRRMADLARQRTHQRRFARHADGGRAMRTAMPSPTHVAFEYPLALRIRVRSAPWRYAA